MANIMSLSGAAICNGVRMPGSREGHVKYQHNTFCTFRIHSGKSFKS